MPLSRDLTNSVWLPRAAIALASVGFVLAFFGLLDLWHLVFLAKYRTIASQVAIGLFCLTCAVLLLLAYYRTGSSGRTAQIPAWFYDTWIAVDRTGHCILAASPFWLMEAPPCAVGESIFASDAWDDAPLRPVRDKLEAAIAQVATDGEIQVWDLFLQGSDRCFTIGVTPHDRSDCVTIWVREKNSCEPLIYERFFHGTLDLFCIVQADGYFSHLNSGWEILGYDRETLLSRPFLDFVHIADRAATHYAFERLLQGETVMNFDNRYRTATGEYQWLSWTAHFDTISGAVHAVARDVAMQKATEAALDAALEDHRVLVSALQSSPVSIFFMERSGECRFCQGEAVHREVGNTTIARGDNLLEQLDPASQSYQAFQRVLDGEEQRWLVQENTRCLQYYARPFRLNPQEVYGVVGVLQDVTLEQEANRELQNQLAQQAAIARLGRDALAIDNIKDLAQRATELLAEVFEVEYAGLFEMLPNGQAFLLQAGVGWKPGLVGVACVGMRQNSLVCYAFDRDEPVFIDDFSIETRFSGPPLLHNHRVVSGMSLKVGESDSPFGVLGVYSESQRSFSDRDATFLQAVANILATALERRRSEEWLHLMNQAIASASTGIVISDARLPDNPVIYVNAAFERITGYDADEVIGQNCRFLQGDEIHSDALDELRAALIEGRDCNVLLRNYRRNGQLFWNNLYLAPIHDANHYLTHFIGAQNDVTDMIHTEAALRNSERRLDSILSSIDAVIWSMDAESGRTLYINPAGETIYGRSLQSFYREPELWQTIVHPEDRGRVLAERQSLQQVDRVETEFRIIQPTGDVRWLYSRCCRVNDESGKAMRFDGIDTDITDIKEAEEQLRHNAFYDRLTDLPNRALFLDRLKHTIQRSRRRGGFMFAVLFLDLDGFKVVNDSLGHLAGDLMLVQIARRLEHCLRPSDTLARLGGDEFTILLEDLYQVRDATQVVERVLEMLKAPFDIFDRDVFTNASIGIAFGRGQCSPSSGEGDESIDYYTKPIDVVRDADIAMYRAKASGKGQYCIFDRAMHAEAVARLQLETALRGAIDADQLQVVYQPIVDINTRRVSGFEALVRWSHPDLGFISPAEFIPIAEETGQIVKIGAWVLERACHQLRTWQTMFAGRTAFDRVTVAVNLSVKQFAQPDLLEVIDRTLEGSQLDPRSLKLEITESAIVDNPTAAVHILQALHERDITLCIDDFGTGYSSLSYLHRFPVNILKIDKSFVTDIDTGKKNQEIVHAIVQLAHHLNMQTIAEGIETEAEYRVLEKFRCDFGQGYLFAKPLDTEEATSLLCEQMLETVPQLVSEQKA